MSHNESSAAVPEAAFVGTRRGSGVGTCLGTRRARSPSARRGFTLIELVITVMVVAIALALLGFRTGTFAYWKEEGFLRRFSETIIFLHHQAVTDQRYYGMRIQLDENNQSYRIGVIGGDPASSAPVSLASAYLGNDAGALTIELSSKLNASAGVSGNLVPPPSFPSLAEPQTLPPGMSIIDIETPRGPQTAREGGEAYILFSPRGLSEYSVIHLRMSTGAPVTLVVNPFTGLTETYREYREFKTKYGAKATA